MLESRKLELARLKSSFLTEAAILGFSRTITIDGHVGEIPSNPEVCFFEE